MKNLYDEMPNGYQQSIEKGLSAVRYFSRNMSYGTGSEEERIFGLKKEIETADSVVIGAGAGLSTSAGLTYSGERFDIMEKHSVRARLKKEAYVSMRTLVKY